MKIVVLDGHTINPGDLSWQPLESLGSLRVYPRTSPEKVIERLQDVDIALTNKCPLNADILKQLPKLRYIGILATGYNIVDCQAASAQNICVTNVPAYSTLSVAQQVFAHLLNISNDIAQHTQAVRQGQWQHCEDFCFSLSPQSELAGRTLGLIGFGATASAVAHIGHSLGMKILAYRPSDKAIPAPFQRASLEQVFSQSDVLSLHCPLTDNNHQLINAQRLAQMKHSAILINTARGPLIDEQALADALNRGKLAAACLDVLSSEPPKADNPLLCAANCHISPHIAWATLEARKRLMDTTCNNLQAFIAGQRQNQVN